jgi:hypothetical protein
MNPNDMVKSGELNNKDDQMVKRKYFDRKWQDCGDQRMLPGMRQIRVCLLSHVST